jgi:lipopolysaccharide/colanic/teichoic acid biosynthesis glycosyltransferase
LPQLFNVLKGEMSLVGPRPEEVPIVQKYNPWQSQRLLVKPGITGSMQVNGRADLPLNERVKLELAYIENYSLLKDIKILLQTVPAVLAGRGSY